MPIDTKMTKDKNRLEFAGLVSLFEETQLVMQRHAVRLVDIALVVRNWLFGWYIVEFEQNGSDRALYGRKVLLNLASELTIKGCSERNLASFRKFHLAYPDILQASPAKCLKPQMIEKPTIGILLCLTKRILNSIL